MIDSLEIGPDWNGYSIACQAGAHKMCNGQAVKYVGGCMPLKTLPCRCDCHEKKESL